MILQRQKPINIWGSCDEDTRITVRLLGQEVSADSKEGTWSVTLPAMEACENTVLEILANGVHLTISDVAIGEVWLAGGQSNMEFYLRYDAERKEATGNLKIRMFDCPKISYEGQFEAGDYSEFGFWRTCDEENLDYFTAVGYYFAIRLEQQYHIPVGIIGCNWGGTPACAWMDPAYLSDNDGAVWLTDYEKGLVSLDLEKYNEEFVKNPDNYRGKPFENKFLEAMMFGLSEEERKALFKSFSTLGEAALPVIGPKSEKRPGGLYETMLKELIPYTFRGAIWYQGENDDEKPEIYHTVLSSLIRCWRDQWLEEFPFLFVQLAPFRYWAEAGRGIYPILRKEQEWVSKHVSNTWMASIMDAGMEFDIHPKEKKPVGERLALLARGHVYGDNILCDAPECTGMTVEEGKIILKFINVGYGLNIKGDTLQALEITINDRLLKDYQTEQNAGQLMVYSKEIHKTDFISVNFAETDYCEVNLYNTANLPVKPFTFHYETVTSVKSGKR